jgi:hypothetical protein
VVSQSSPSRYFADAIIITRTTQAIAVVLSLAIVFFEVLPMSISNTVSATTAAMTRTRFNTILLSLSSLPTPLTIKPLKSTDAAAKFNHIVASYGGKVGFS